MDKKPVVGKEDQPSPISSLTDMVDRTAEQISFLKKKQENLQKEKADLEELRRQREELDSVKREVWSTWSGGSRFWIRKRAS